MTRLEALISLNMVGDIGSIRLKRLLEFFGKPEEILKAPVEKLINVSGIGREIANKIHSLKKEDLDRELKLAKKFGLKILTPDDAAYPENLKSIYDPPIALYVKGQILPQDKFSLGIVGSRRASYYGLSSAEKFARELAEKSFTIVSGMARGIDTAAHKGTLRAGGRTLAIIGSGFNYLYPPENRELAEEIAKNGAVISEFPVNMQPLPQNFPQRNRVISGLSLGLLVVEAAQNSGALITADFALEQGREVFALPGKVDSNTSFGTNELIKQGAKLVSSAQDILEEFGLSVSVRKESREKKENNLKPDLVNQESDLYRLISKEPVFIDELAEKTRLAIPQITGLLLGLQLKKLIKQLPGKHYIRSVA